MCAKGAPECGGAGHSLAHLRSVGFRLVFSDMLSGRTLHFRRLDASTRGDDSNHLSRTIGGLETLTVALVGLSSVFVT